MANPEAWEDKRLSEKSFAFLVLQIAEAAEGHAVPLHNYWGEAGESKTTTILW